MSKLHAFVLCLNSNDVRMDASKVFQIQSIINIFGPKHFFRNLAIVMTHWDFSSKAEKSRKLKGLEQQTIIDKVQLAFEGRLKPEQVFFVDNDLYKEELYKDPDL